MSLLILFCFVLFCLFVFSFSFSFSFCYVFILFVVCQEIPPFGAFPLIELNVVIRLVQAR